MRAPRAFLLRGQLAGGRGTGGRGQLGCCLWVPRKLSAAAGAAGGTWAASPSQPPPWPVCPHISPTPHLPVPTNLPILQLIPPRGHTGFPRRLSRQGGADNGVNWRSLPPAGPGADRKELAAPQGAEPRPGPAGGRASSPRPPGRICKVLTGTS